MENYPSLPPHDPPVDDMPSYLPGVSNPNVPPMGMAPVEEAPFPNPGADLVPGTASAGMTEWQASPTTYPSSIAHGGKAD